MRDGIWDGFESGVTNQRNEHTFPFINHDDEEEVLLWLKNDFESKLESRRRRLEILRRLDSMFKGLPYYVGGKAVHTSEFEDMQNTKRPASIYNFINEMVEAKVSQRARFKPSFVVIPNKVDIQDENRAEAAKTLLMAKSQELDLDKLISDGDKTNFLSGESYTYIRWNKMRGGISPIFKEAIKLGLQPKDDDGEPIPVAYRGDIDIQVLGPDRAFHQLGKKRWEDVDDCTIVDWVHVDELKALYPDREDEIHPTGAEVFDIEDLVDYEEYSYHSLVLEYYHRPTPFLPTGAYVKYTPDTILEINVVEYPYEDNELPIIFDTDIDAQGEITGRPFTANIEKLQRLHDMVTASMARGFAIASSPKWVYQKGSIDPNKLGNNYASLEVRGPVEPKLVSYSGLPQGGLEIMSTVERGIEKGASVYGISRGEPPKGIKAAVALQFLDEQEMQRESRGMAKRNRRITQSLKMVLSRCQQFYTPEDGRVLRYLGDDNSYLILDLATMDVTGDFDIKIENSSSLPDSKTGKIAAILDLNTATQQDPMFSKEQIAQVLDLGNDKRFRIQATSALKSAQFKLQMILNSQGNPEPKPYDDFILEYPMFVQALRQRDYKGTNEQVYESLKNYITSMEFLMWEKAKMNPVFQQRSLMFSEYPIFFKVPLMSPQAPQGEVEPPKTKAITEMDINEKAMATDIPPSQARSEG